MRPIYWRFEFRNKKRQHALLIGTRLWIEDVRLDLQSCYLLSCATSIADACRLTDLFLPEFVVVGPELKTPYESLLLIERLRRFSSINSVPIFYVSADKYFGNEALRRGATEVIKINKSVAIAESISKFIASNSCILD